MSDNTDRELLERLVRDVAQITRDLKLALARLEKILKRLPSQ